MRKTLVALCTVAILVCNILIPITACAEEKSCNHNMSGEYDVVVSDEYAYSHQFLIYNGPNGPVYDTCAVHRVTHNIYPRCTLCGYVFIYNTPTVRIENRHQHPECPDYH